MEKEEDPMQVLSKQENLAKIEPDLANFGVRVASVDPTKPWGVEVAIDIRTTAQFFTLMFRGVLMPKEVIKSPRSPKILLIEQGKRLSWHVHERKEKYLRVRMGSVGLYVSRSDVQPSFPTVQGSPSEIVCIAPGIRHRLSSLSGWAVVAEISRDIDPKNPSDETDIRRIADDFGRV